MEPPQGISPSHDSPEAFCRISFRSWAETCPRPFLGARGGAPGVGHLHRVGKSPCLMGKSTISMAIFNNYVSLPEGILYLVVWNHGILWLSIQLGLSSSQLTNSYFVEGFKPPTSFHGYVIFSRRYVYNSLWSVFIYYVILLQWTIFQE